MRDVCEIVDIKMSQAQYWTRKGVVKPDISGTTTQGIPRLFSMRNLFEFFLARELTRLGIGVIEVRDVLEEIRKLPPSMLEQHADENVNWRLLVDPLLVYFRKGFFLGTLHEIDIKGVRHIFLWEEPPPKFLEDFQVRGFEMKVSVVVQYYNSAMVVNLEALRRELTKRLQEVG
jgi:DNA-binding transcriptional MerR regulator